MKPQEIKDVLKDQVCFVIGGGPSAVHVPHKNVITTNLAFRLNPEPLAMYFADCDFYKKYQKEIANVKARYWITVCPMMMLEQEWIVFYRNATSLSEYNRVFGTNSGLHAAHIALKMGASTVVLVGFDMNDRTHFHNEYLMGESNPVKFVKQMEVLRGHNVYLTNEKSALRHLFPYKPLEDFL